MVNLCNYSIHSIAEMRLLAYQSVPLPDIWKFEVGECLGQKIGGRGPAFSCVLWHFTLTTAMKWCFMLISFTISDLHWQLCTLTTVTAFVPALSILLSLSERSKFIQFHCSVATLPARRKICTSHVSDICMYRQKNIVVIHTYMHSCHVVSQVCGCDSASSI